MRTLLASAREAVPGVYLVGGAVRDLLLGRRPTDLDFVSSTDGREAAEAIARTVAGHAFPLDVARGVFRLVMPPDAPVRDIDVSMAGEGLDADLRRRDFTVNALAAPVLAGGELGEVVDVCGGLEDLEAGLLRMTSTEALPDDPLRLLRAARLATELGFEIEDETAAAIRELAPSLASTAGERQREEFLRILATGRAADGMRLLDSLRLLDVLLPELTPAKGVDQPKNHHYYDVFEHSLATLQALDEMVGPTAPGPAAGKRASGQSGNGGGRGIFALFGKKQDAEGQAERPWLGDYFRRGLAEFEVESYLDERVGGTTRRALLKLAGLLHDVSKPETKTVAADGKVRFLGHPELGAAKAQAICSRLRFGNRETAFVAKLVEEHLRPTMLSSGGLPSARALYRFYRDLDDAAKAVLVLTLADGAGAAGPNLKPDRWRGNIAYMAYILEQGSVQAESTRAQPRLVTGDDLIRELGLAPGPALGRLLEAIAEAHAAGEVASKEEALALASQLAAELAVEEREKA